MKFLKNTYYRIKAFLLDFDDTEAHPAHAFKHSFLVLVLILAIAYLVQRFYR